METYITPLQSIAMYELTHISGNSFYLKTFKQQAEKMLKTFIYFTLKKLTGSLNINYHLCDIFGVQ